MNIYRLFASEFLRPTLIAEDSGGSKSIFTKIIIIKIKIKNKKKKVAEEDVVLSRL